MMAAENRRKPGLNAMCFESEHQLAKHIADAANRGERGIQRAIAVVFDEKKQYYHAVLYETTFTENGTFIRGYDPLEPVMNSN